MTSFLFSFFLMILLFLNSALASSDELDGDGTVSLISFPNIEVDVKKSARHLVRPLIRKNCSKQIKINSEEELHKRQKQENSQDQESFNINIYVFENKRGLDFALRSWIYVESLDNKIVLCLQGKKPEIYNIACAFDGVEELLKEKGYYLDDNAQLCKKP